MKFIVPVLLLSTVTLAFSAPAFSQVKRIKTIAGTGVGAFGGDGNVSTSAALNAPMCVSVDPSGGVYIVDRLNSRIRKIATSGIMVTIAGNGSYGCAGDGSIGTSAEMRPNGMTLDKNGNVFISDPICHTIRVLNTSGIINKIAGNGVSASAGNGGPALAASFISPYGMAFDTAGNLYVADGIAQVVRKINPAGIVSTFAGTDTAGFAGDTSAAITAALDSPYAVATDRRGNVFITDMQNNRIRRVDASGIIWTYAGNGTYGYSGDGGPAYMAQLNRPAGIATDDWGNLYIADADNNVIRKVDTFGIITTVVGNGTPGFGGDYGDVMGCNLKTPFGVAVDKSGEIYIADANNQRIRKTYTTTAVDDVNAKARVEVYPNPAANAVVLSGVEQSDVVTVYDITGRFMGQAMQHTAGNQLSVNIADYAPGTYVMHISGADGISKAVVRLVKE